MSCNHGHDDHHHHHDQGGHEPEALQKRSLLEFIDLEQVAVYNSSSDARAVFKPWDQRLNLDPFVESLDDPELLFKVPFTTMVKIHAIVLRGWPVGGAAPKKLKTYINRETLDFSNLEDVEATQTWDLVQGDAAQEVAEYKTRVTKFNSVHCVHLYFPENFGVDTTKVSFIAFLGETREYSRKMLTNVQYEYAANPADHKTKADQPNTFTIH